jgi:hypothetical protein
MFESRRDFRRIAPEVIENRALSGVGQMRLSLRRRRPDGLTNMTFVWYPIILGLAVLMTVLLRGYVHAAFQFVDATFLHTDLTPADGVLASISGAVMTTIFVLFTQNRRIPHFILRYRSAEERLIEFKKMQVEEIVRYHTEFNWDVYASMSVGALIIVVSVLYEKKDVLTDQKGVVIFLSLLFLALSATLLAIVDMFHTNTLSPLITTHKRFQLVDLTLKIGSIAIVLQICAISSFVALINVWLSFLVSAASLWLVVFFAVRRGVSLDDLKRERNLTDREAEEIWRA